MKAQVLLYYLYTKIEDAESYYQQHRELCESLELKGRVLIAKEGINGTLAGSPLACQSYMDYLKNDPITEGIEFKIDEWEEEELPFPKLSVKLREEVVTLRLGEEDLNPGEVTGAHLSPKEFREMMDDPDAVVLDARNDYEWKLGRFKGAILPEVKNFRDLPQWVRDNREILEGKKIMTYCTGGIRCEKFSGFLLNEGFEDVYQLHGGIVTYGKDDEVKGDQYEGTCYVFDERIQVPVNRTEGASVITHCIRCEKSTTRYINCAYILCNEQHFCCEECEEETKSFCAPECEVKGVESGRIRVPRHL